MLDHLVGKPSPNFKRTQTILTLIFGWYFIVYGKTRQLPRFIQQLNKKAGRSPWRIVLGSWLMFYLSQNIFLLVGLNAPDPLSRLYKRSFYRATWILTALDAGFFTAMPFKPTWIRHFLSIVFSAYYLVFADAAEEKVRKTRATISIEQMRNSWEKGCHNPVLATISRLLRPTLMLADILSIPRPDYHRDLPPVEVYRYYYSDRSKQFEEHDTILLQFPGGGFVSMPPPCHEDALYAWAKQTELPVFSVNYRKAPEYPYPWPIEECFDFYVAIVESKGKVIGLKGDKDVRIILVGDSAGGNVTAAVTLKILAHNQQLAMQQEQQQEVLSILDGPITVPVGLVLIYPVLDFEMSCWMSTSQLSLIRAESNTDLFRSSSLDSIWQTKDHLSHASPLSVVPDLEKKQSLWRRALGIKPSRQKRVADRAHPIRDKIQTKDAWATARLAMTSRMSFFNDRIISPDLLRAMAILYLGPHASPDFASDYLLSPVHAPEALLAQFPMTYMICGEKDPLVDDTVIFAGRIRQARRKYRQENPLDQTYVRHDGVRVKFLEGISHAFLQMMPFLSEAQQATRTIGDWVKELAHRKQPKVVRRQLSRTNTTPLEDHVAQIITTEKDMIHRRKQQLVKGLY
ncbi:Alpha/Beta hydrolase protein [Choanephora cucurbitarum]|nr:Alpha/Beta hydrolase protein [Choanephora cucurbitarum]